mgnify:CR=1 FL=1
MDAVDSCLKSPAKIVLIGGSAVILAHGVTTTTVDIDTLNGVTAALEHAFEEAYQLTGLRPPVSHSGVAFVPERYEERLVRQATGGLLELWVLEKHDLAISKVVRGDERDRQHLRAIHEHDPFEFEILVARFKDEMLPIYVGDESRPIARFLWIIEELFGELRRARVERALKRQ